MKKITLSLCSLALCLTGFGQTGLSKVKLIKPVTMAKKAPVANKTTSTTRGFNTNPTVQAAFYTNDFSVPATWTMNSPVGNGTPSAVWVIDTIGPAGTGSAAPYNIPKIKSTTYKNGFATFDSNNNCSGSQVADMTTTSAISCTGHQFIYLGFQEMYRRWFDSTFVFVSKDNFVTSTKYVINKTMAINDQTANPTNIKLDISAAAGNQATVKIRFEFYAPGSLTTNSPGCGFSFMIDDVYLADMPANDLSVDTAFADFGFKNGGFYTQTPISQILPMTFRAAVSNQGSAAQTNVKLTVGITNGASSVFNQAGGVFASLPYRASTDLYDTLTAFTPPSSVATYNARWEVTQTQTENAADTANNSMVRTFAVSDTVFARDNGISKTATTGAIDFEAADSAGCAIGNLFLIANGGTLASVSAYIDSSTAVGTTIQYAVYRVDSAGGFSAAPVAVSKIYSVTAKLPLSKWMTMAVPPTPVVAGNYVACVLPTGQTAGTTSSQPIGVFVGNDKATLQPKSTSFVSVAGSWGFINQLPMIRLNLVKGPAGIREQSNELTLASAFPNPANRSIAINYSLSNVSDVVIEIYDIAGKKMTSIKETAVTGTRVSNIDLSAYAAGTYFYSVTSNHAKLNGKFVVSK